MIIVMKVGASQAQVEHVTQKIEALGFKSHVIEGEERCVIGAIGHEKKKADLLALNSVPGVEAVIPISKPYKLASKELRKKPSIIKIHKNLSIGGDKIIIMAGPCSVESEEQILRTALAVKKAGGHMIRGGAFKPRTSPYSFQGLAEAGLKLLDKARQATGLPVVTEVMSQRDVELVERYADVVQVGARNIQNFSLLKELGKIKKPILLKRGMATTIQEWLMSAEYILSEGNPQVILCERGIRTFETATRNTLDLNAVPILKKESHLPIVVDPSHATGIRDIVIPMALAAVACGSDGIMLEIHPNPDQAWSDGMQSLTLEMFAEGMQQLRAVAKAVGRTL